MTLSTQWGERLDQFFCKDSSALLFNHFEPGESILFWAVKYPLGKYDCIKMSPDANYLAYISHNKVHVISVTEKKKILEVNEPDSIDSLTNW